MKRFLCVLCVILLVLQSMLLPVSANASISADNSRADALELLESEYSFEPEQLELSIHGMEEIADGVYWCSIEVPCMVVRTSNVAESSSQELETAAYSTEFIFTLEAWYKIDYGFLQVGMNLSRNYGTGLIKSMTVNKVSYTTYYNDQIDFVQRGSESNIYMLKTIPGTLVAATAEFSNVYFGRSGSIVINCTGGTFTLLDGYGSFGSTSKTIQVTV